MKTKDWVTDHVTLNNLSTRQVAIMGASYGGYATLAGLCFTPDVYRCGIDIVGPAHIKVGGCGWDGFWLFGVVWFVCDYSRFLPLTTHNARRRCSSPSRRTGPRSSAN